MAWRPKKKIVPEEDIIENAEIIQKNQEDDKKNNIIISDILKKIKNITKQNKKMITKHYFAIDNW
jgi:hypothetical protein